MTHDERARKWLVACPDVAVTEDDEVRPETVASLAAQFAEVEKEIISILPTAAQVNNSLKQHKADAERIAQLEADLRAAHGSVDLRDKRIAQLEAENVNLKAKAEVIGGEWCLSNRAAGRGPCGACAVCCQEGTERIAQLEAALDDAILAVEHANHPVANQWLPKLRRAKVKP